MKKEDPQIVLAKAEAISRCLQTNSTANIHICGYHQTRILQQNWTPPLAGCFKLKMGATANRDKQMSGFGAVIIDAGGNVIAAKIRSSKFYEDMAYMEGEAMQLGLQVAGNAKPSSFIFETDSQEVADFVNNGQSSMKEIFWVVSEIQNLMKYQNSSIYLDIVMQLLILLLS